ncbi:DUF397 domain-containing protein [Pseudonocardia acaciae]|uniref:DUF397 domain-containing protein n=1 Tax=Pseudonocardia acaciae TaxID=551276 RepID=UPI000490B039|nr:DUF397 domain-containing protein [Pseudonocardia acaciae]
MPKSSIDWTEVPFTKSSYSKSDGGECVEIATAEGRVAIRDSKLTPHSPTLEVSEPAFAAFIATIRTT